MPRAAHLILLLQLLPLSAARAQVRNQPWPMIRRDEAVELRVDNSSIMTTDSVSTLTVEYTFLADSIRPVLGQLGPKDTRSVARAVHQVQIDCRTSRWRWLNDAYLAADGAVLASQVSEDGWRTVTSTEPLALDFAATCGFLQGRAWKP